MEGAKPKNSSIVRITRKIFYARSVEICCRLIQQDLRKTHPHPSPLPAGEGLGKVPVRV